MLCAAAVSSLGCLAHGKDSQNVTSDTIASIDKTISIKADDLRILKKKARVSDNPLTVDDFIGKYVWDGFGAVLHIGFSEEDVWPFGGCLSIVKDPDNSELAIIKGFDKYGDLKDCYVENNRLYIPNQIVGYDDDHEAYVQFHNSCLRLHSDGNKYDIAPYTNCLFYFMLTEDGSLVARSTDIDIDRLNAYLYEDEELEDLICVAMDYTIKSLSVPIPTSQHWYCTLINGVPLEDYFIFNQDEWVSTGNATFKDAWFPNVWEHANTPSYEVPLYADKSNEFRFLLKDPYGLNTPYGEKGYNLSDSEGYIIFNIEDPDHVYFEPYIYGCTIKEESLFVQEPVAFYPYNTEGLYNYSWGHTPDKIKIKNSIPSTFSEGSRLISINNACYSVADESVVLNHCFWENYNMDGYIVLPKNYSSIEEVVYDSSEYPVEYYNLQGTRLDKPQKGQIVIIRQGNQVTKQLIR